MVSGLPANIVAGLLSRHLPMGKLLAVGAAVLAVSLVFFPFIGSLGAAIAYASLLGISGGVITVIYFAIYGHTYGRLNIGSIQAVVQVLSVFASAIGPVILAVVRKRYESTDLFFFGFAGLTVFLAISAWFVPVPERQAISSLAVEESEVSPCTP
jgi:MFS family permease